MVWAAVMILALVGFGAFAVDFGSFYVADAELQTSADAGALAGALALQTTPATTAAAREAAVDAAGVAVANANQVHAMGAAQNVTNERVVLGWWVPTNPPATRFTTTTPAALPANSAPNAVQVTASRQTEFLFGRALQNVFGTGGPPLLRDSAVAWVANFNNANCVIPWALPYRALYDRVSTITGITNPAAAPAPLFPGKRPDLSQAQLAALDTFSLEAPRLIVFRPPNHNGQGSNPDSTKAVGNLGYNDGRYSAYNLAGSAGSTAFQDGIIACSPQYMAVGGVVEGATLPGSNPLECYTINALMGSVDNGCQISKGWPTAANEPKVNRPVTCYYRATTAPYDAGCYSDAARTQQGIIRNVTWGDSVTTGSNEVRFRLIGKLKIICVFRLPAGTGMTEVCNTDVASVRPSNYPMGTVVGVIQTPARPPLEAGTVLGNVVSDQQMLILVR
jgi:Flp pilus assembly protein TadG